MGMLFNTDGTLDVAKAANKTFRIAALTEFRKDLNNWVNTFNKLGAIQQPYNPTGSTYDLVTKYLPIVGGVQLTIKPSATSGAGSPGNWQKWLGYFDTQVNSLATIDGEIVAKTVGKEIANVLSNTSHNAVEFFVVPEGKYTTISAESNDFADGGGQLTRIITIYTNTFDKLR
jgi:hypothetical protein